MNYLIFGLFIGAFILIYFIVVKADAQPLNGISKKTPKKKFRKKKEFKESDVQRELRQMEEVLENRARKQKLNAGLKEINGIMHYQGNPYSGVFLERKRVYENGIDITNKFSLFLTNNAKHLHKVENEGLEYQYNYYIENNLSIELNKISDDEVAKALSAGMKELLKLPPEELKRIIDEEIHNINL